MPSQPEGNTRHTPRCERLHTCSITCTCTYMHMLMYMPCISRANSFKIPKCTFAEVLIRKIATSTATAANKPRLSTCIEDFELDPFRYVGLSFSTHGTFALWGQLPPPSLVPRVLCGIDCQSGMRVHRTVCRHACGNCAAQHAMGTGTCMHMHMHVHVHVHVLQQRNP